MSTYDAVCMIAGLSVLIAMVNHRFGKIQTTIAITGWSILISLILMILTYTGIISTHKSIMLVDMVNGLHFDDFLLKGILGFLLFGGAMNVKVAHIKDQKFEIAFLAIAGTLFSTFFVGTVLFYVLSYVGLKIAFIYCCLFGALISPTDPIAVLAIVKKLNAPQRISTQIEGESLFNDGIGLVIFVTLFNIAFGETAPTVTSTVVLFVQEAIGGIIFGAVLGVVFHYLIKHSHDNMLRLLLTLLVPSTGYVITEHLGLSAPLAMVVAGMVIGNWTRDHISEDASYQINHLWELTDELLNGILFLMIGFIVVTFTFHKIDAIAAVIAVPVVLCARYFAVKLSYCGFNLLRSYNPESVKILTWGGLRGGLSMAMAMAIPSGIQIGLGAEVDLREVIVLMTYVIVIFSILVQGSTITPLIEKAKRHQQ